MHNGRGTRSSCKHQSYLIMLSSTSFLNASRQTAKRSLTQQIRKNSSSLHTLPPRMQAEREEFFVHDYEGTIGNLRIHKDTKLLVQVS